MYYAEESESELSYVFLSAGTAMSSPRSEVDGSGAILEDKEDSYFNEIRNFISNTGQSQTSPDPSEEGWAEPDCLFWSDLISTYRAILDVFTQI